MVQVGVPAAALGVLVESGRPGSAKADACEVDRTCAILPRVRVVIEPPQVPSGGALRIRLADGPEGTRGADVVAVSSEDEEERYILIAARYSRDACWRRIPSPGWFDYPPLSIDAKRGVRFILPPIGPGHYRLDWQVYLPLPPPPPIPDDYRDVPEHHPYSRQPTTEEILLVGQVEVTPHRLGDSNKLP